MENSEEIGTNSANQPQEKMAENKRSSKESESSCVKKQPEEHQRNPYTTQDKDETVENSKEKRTSSVQEPQEKREKMTGNGQNITDGFGEGNSKEDGTSCVEQAQEISMDLSTTQEKDHTEKKSKEKRTGFAHQWENLRRTIKTHTSKITLSKKTEDGAVHVHYGLDNQGATCYLNSILQVLYMTTEIHNRLDESQNTDRELKKIFETLEKEKGQTENLTQCLQIENVHEQRDAAECLEVILNTVSPHASEVFQGQLMYTTTCKSSNHIINEETNPFWTLPLPLTDDHNSVYSVEDNFSSFFETKEFGGEDLVYCEACQKEGGASSACKMVHSPQILTLLLKRFTFDDRAKSYFKSNRSVDVPLVLSTENKRYELYGMVNHLGQLGGGHYTATLRTKNSKVWFEFSDALIQQNTFQQPWWQPSAGRTYSSCSAYLLMYRGKDVKKKQDIFRGITNIKKPNKKKDDEAPLGNKNSRAQQLQEEKKEEKEKEKQGDKTNNYTTSFPENESRILPDRSLTTSESQTPDKTKSEDVMEAEMKTQGERKDSQSKTEYGEEPEMTADSGDDTSVNGGGAKNMETVDDVSFQWKDERDTQDNKKPTATDAPSSPEDVLRRTNQVKQNPNRNKNSKMSNETGHLRGSVCKAEGTSDEISEEDWSHCQNWQADLEVTEF
ncbi:uncharacterized protein LOC142889528 isoform X2 [Nelusetta ayraudi]|uniref:uncharacterized protein LOC142889528 isoform X2 n=1 Tax=Nelusetta ayraudi TaxID=303726 RepID=UPI003F72AED9